MRSATDHEHEYEHEHERESQPHSHSETRTTASVYHQQVRLFLRWLTIHVDRNPLDHVGGPDNYVRVCLFYALLDHAGKAWFHANWPAPLPLITSQPTLHRIDPASYPDLLDLLVQYTAFFTRRPHPVVDAAGMHPPVATIQVVPNASNASNATPHASTDNASYAANAATIETATLRVVMDGIGFHPSLGIAPLQAFATQLHAQQHAILDDKQKLARLKFAWDQLVLLLRIQDPHHLLPRMQPVSLPDSFPDARDVVQALFVSFYASPSLCHPQAQAQTQAHSHHQGQFDQEQHNDRRRDAHQQQQQRQHEEQYDAPPIEVHRRRVQSATDRDASVIEHLAAHKPWQAPAVVDADLDQVRHDDVGHDHDSILPPPSTPALEPEHNFSSSLFSPGLDHAHPDDDDDDDDDDRSLLSPLTRHSRHHLDDDNDEIMSLDNLRSESPSAAAAAAAASPFLPLDRADAATTQPHVLQQQHPRPPVKKTYANQPLQGRRKRIGSSNTRQSLQAFKQPRRPDGSGRFAKG